MRAWLVPVDPVRLDDVVEDPTLFGPAFCHGSHQGISRFGQTFRAR
jgi:hypothetical protein